MIRVIKLLISILYYVARRLQHYFSRIIKSESAATCMILYYHSVTSAERSRFASQMDDLIRYAKPVAVDSSEPLTKGVHHAAVTFDDGFQNVLNNALPELTKRQIPFTIFITTGSLGKVPQWKVNSKGNDKDFLIMDAKQIKSIPSNYVSIGSHTVTHPRLTQIEETAARIELTESRKQLEKISGRKIQLFSFPHGEYSQHLLHWAKEAGYKRVFTIMPKFAFSDANEFVSGRVCTSAKDWILEFRLKLLGAYNWQSFIFTLKQNLRVILNN